MAAILLAVATEYRRELAEFHQAQQACLLGDKVRQPRRYVGVGVASSVLWFIQVSSCRNARGCMHQGTRPVMCPLMHVPARICGLNVAACCALRLVVPPPDVFWPVKYIRPALCVFSTVLLYHAALLFIGVSCTHRLPPRTHPTRADASTLPSRAHAFFMPRGPHPQRVEAVMQTGPDFEKWVKHGAAAFPFMVAAFVAAAEMGSEAAAAVAAKLEAGEGGGLSEGAGDVEEGVGHHGVE